MSNDLADRVTRVAESRELERRARSRAERGVDAPADEPFRRITDPHWASPSSDIGAAVRRRHIEQQQAHTLRTELRPLKDKLERAASLIHEAESAASVNAALRLNMAELVVAAATVRFLQPAVQRVEEKIREHSETERHILLQTIDPLMGEYTKLLALLDSDDIPGEVYGARLTGDQRRAILRRDLIRLAGRSDDASEIDLSFR